MVSLRTSDVARRAGVNIETLRFYERNGILPEPPRRASGYREYPPEAVRRVRFVKRAQELGFSLREIKDLLDLTTVPRAKAGKVRHMAEAKIVEIDHKIRDLQAMKATLEGLLCACDGRRPLATCPIIESLSSSCSSDEADGGGPTAGHGV